MRTDNGKVKNIIISVYFILIVFTILMAIVFRAFNRLTDNEAVTFLIFISLFILLLFGVYLVAKYFEYDSDGMKVVVLNRGLLLSQKIDYRLHLLEFDKTNLVKYKFQNYFFYKVLVLYTKNEQGTISKDRFNISLVNRKKRKYIRQSLSKILKNNNLSNNTF